MTSPVSLSASATLDAAHDYVRRGWGVIPLHGWDAEKQECRCSAGRFCPEKSRGKHPALGNQWQNRALTSGADTQAWFDEHPTNNVGILTGAESGIFVFDVDGAAGIASVTNFAREFGAMPPTRIVRTGSGGLHYFFRHPGHYTVHNSTSWVAPGIDIRGKGGQVVAPPSISGRGSYEVIADHSLADPPPWMSKLLREHSENVEHGRTAEVKGAERVDVALMPEKVRTAAATLVEADQGRFRQFHHIVASCREVGYSQGQTVTIVAPWCVAVDKFVGRVEAEVARCWGKLEAEAAKAADWLPDLAQIPSNPDLTPGETAPTPAPTLTTVPADEPTIPDPPPTWAPVDLTPILSGSYIPEVPDLFPRSDSHHLVYPGRVHSFHGESESGKSLVVQAEAARLVSSGADVLYVDFESDAAAVVGRLLDLGAAPDAIRTHFTYLRPDNDPRKFVHEREHYAAVLARRFTLAVIDGMTDALGIFGAGSSDNDEISDFMRSVPRRIATRTGAAVAIVDHVTKDADSRGRWAVGGQAKMNALDGAAYVVEVTEALGRGMRGVVSLRVAKDRPGGVRPHCGQFRKIDRTQEAARVVVDSTGGDGKIEVTVEAPLHTVEEGGATAKEFRPTVLMERVSTFLFNATEPVSQKTLLEGVSGNDKAIKQAVAILVSEGFVGVSQGERKAQFHELLKPYASHQDPASDDYMGWVETDTDDPTSATSANLGHDLGQKEVSDLGQPSPPPTGMAEVNGGGTDVTSAMTSAKSAAYLEVACKKCYRPTPKVVADTFSGLCGTCAGKEGLLA